VERPGPALAYLDTNSVRDLFRQGTSSESRIRTELRAATRRGVFAFCTSYLTFQELAVVGKADWPMYCRILKFLSPLVGSRVIPQIGSLVERELATPSRKLFGDGCYLDEAELRELHTWTNQRGQVEVTQSKLGSKQG
jgi:hypothetical protein